MTNARMKKIGKIAGLTLAGIAVLALVMLLSLGHIVKFSLTSIAPKVLDAPVKVDSVSVNVFSGVVDIRNLFIGNPVGYKNDRALTVKHIRVDIIPSTLTADKLVVEEFTLDGVDVYFEPSANLLSNNLSQLNENVQNFQKKLGVEEKTAQKKDDAGLIYEERPRTRSNGGFVECISGDEKSIRLRINHLIDDTGERLEDGHPHKLRRLGVCIRNTFETGPEMQIGTMNESEMCTHTLKMIVHKYKRNQGVTEKASEMLHRLVSPP